MSYVYLQSEPSLFTVGFYDPDGEWQSESDHSAPEKAAERVAYLNGGGDALGLRGAIRQLKEQVKGLQLDMIDVMSTFPWSEQARRKDSGELVEAAHAALKETLANLQTVVKELEGKDDPFMPPDAVWQWLPEAKCVAVDENGKCFWYDREVKPSADEWYAPHMRDAEIGFFGVRDLGNADWRTTLRHRPAGI